MLDFLIVLIFGFLTFFVFYVLSKNTHLRLNFKTGNFWPILIYRELFFVYSALLLVAAYGVDVFDGTIINAGGDDLFKIYALTIYAVFGFFISTLISIKIFKIPLIDLSAINTLDDLLLRRFVNAAVLTGLFILFGSIIFLGFKHAFGSILISGGDLLAVRLGNVYNSKLPSQLGQVMNVAWWIIAIYIGYLLFRRNYFQFFLYFSFGFMLASAHGDKAPIFQFLTIFGLSFASFSGIELSAKILLKLLFFVFPPMYFLLYGVVSLQIPDLSFEIFNIYLLNRLGVGQMSGVFETFSMSNLEGDFYWHMVPGASIFVNYIPYDKVLMMVSEGYGFTEMGVKNSFFISEAYAIGGYLLVFMSPFIVGFSYGFGIYLLSRFLLYLFGRSISLVFALPIYIFNAALTGGFSSFPLFKGLILAMACLGLIWVVFSLLRLRLGSIRG